ncbi:MAG: hypothetical protein IT316_03490 [Anaerolineales bacterium]|nr:hypothetical protein [Anaerolineales bacterium]
MRVLKLSRLGYLLLILVPLIVLLALGYWVFRGRRGDNGRSARVLDWIRNPAAHPEWAVQGGQRCGDAPFVMPTSGYIGFLWDDSFRVGHRHQGIDIFGGADVNVTPVYAAYPGYLTRKLDWKSSVIVRIPQDPLQPGRQVWAYYTHMASPNGESYIAPTYPPGIQEVYVEEGALLGFQGNYSGTPGNPVGVHLHFSIVKDDGSGHFLNELEIENTLDPSPYLGLPLNAGTNQGQIPVCGSQAQSS